MNATRLFVEVGHSNAAYEQMEQFQIGKLES